MRNPTARQLRVADRMDRTYRAARARGLTPREAERYAVRDIQRPAGRRRRRNPMGHGELVDVLVPVVALFLLMRGGVVKVGS